MSVTISIRVDDDVKRDIEELGYRPGEYLKRILMEELKRERSLQSLEWISKHRVEPEGPPAEQLIRENRDSR